MTLLSDIADSSVLQLIIFSAKATTRETSLHVCKNHERDWSVSSRRDLAHRSVTYQKPRVKQY